MINKIKIPLFKLWARTGVALGWLYQIVDKNAGSFKGITRKTKILKNCTLDCDLGDHIQRQIYFFGAYEPIESYLLQVLLEPSDVVVDAGANIGFYSLLVSQSTSQGKVIAFEPVPRNFAILKKNIDTNHKNKTIFPINNGLWNESKQLQFSLSDTSLDNVGSFTAGAVENAGLRFLCDVKRMDELLAEEKRIDFIKMDIEGAELNALRGAEMLIEKHRPQFLIEINRAACLGFGYDPQEIADFFARWGYEFYQVGDTVERSRWIQDFSHIQQANVIVVNEKRKNKIPLNWQAKAIKRNFIDAQS